MATVAKSSARKIVKPSSKAGDTYHGVRVPDMSGGSQFTREQVVKAVNAAIAKHADALAGRHKA